MRFFRFSYYHRNFDLYHLDCRCALRLPLWESNVDSCLLQNKNVNALSEEVDAGAGEIYSMLNPSHKKYFEHRLATFMESYQFIGRGGYEVTDETKITIGAVYVMMTFGMRKYITNVFDKIVVYLSEFFSKAHGRNHKGEFNFRYRTIVFSWDDFLSGLAEKEDNLNLGVHEFTHVLSFHGKISND